VEKKNRPIHQKVHSEKTIRVTVTMQAPRLVTERLIIEKLKLQDYPKNAASIALLEKIGMRKEAHLKQSVWIDGRAGHALRK
jgi:hypothetical protein